MSRIEHRSRQLTQLEKLASLTQALDGFTPVKVSEFVKELFVTK